MDNQLMKEEVRKAFGFAKEMTDEQLARFVRHCTIEEVQAGTVLAEKIESCPGLLLIISGVLKVSKISDDGREVTIYRIGKGRTCPLSTICLLGNLKGYFAKVIAEVKTKVLWVSRDFVSRSMVECEPFWRFILGCMANRLYESIQVVDHIAFIPVKNRLAQLLLLKSNYGKHPIYTTHDTLAREIGTAREVVSRELKNFERSGFLTLARGLVTIKSIKELEVLAAGNYQNKKE